MDWEAVIGLEVHVQLKTKSKAFSSSAVDFGAEPNTLCDPTVLALPGALPVFQEGALTQAMRLGLALGCQIAPTSRFARKHYFYPDQPAGYQISQYDEPICLGGALPIVIDDEERSIALTRIHLENDAGKSTHTDDGSLVDLNRAGVTLCEVVSEPVMHSAQEAASYMRALRQLVRYLDVSEGDMEKGQLRCDANVSIRRRGDKELGTRTELKNINSFKFVEQALDYEIRRHISVLEEGGHIEQETRLWDTEMARSQRMRGKEDAMDYRYFPDPDLPPLVVSEERKRAVKESLGELPWQARARLQEMSLGKEQVSILTAEPELLRYFYSVCENFDADPRLAANWCAGELLAELKRAEREPASSPLTPQRLAELLARISDNSISAKSGKSVLTALMDAALRGEDKSADEIIAEEGLAQVSDEGAIAALIDEILAKNAAQVEKFKAGQTKLLGFFVGQVMKASKGKANPKLVDKLLRERLGQS